jgi:hypothetical protein
MTLADTQKWFVDAIIAEEPPADAEERVRGHLHVYRHAYVARLIECLEDDYPVVFHALGRDRAEELCRGYIAKYPSRSFSLNVFGQHMSAFLKDEGEAFASDLAALEWSVVEAIHAAEAAKMAPDALAKIDPSEWANVSLVAAPSLRLHSFSYPVNAYYTAFHNDEEPTIPAPAPEHIAVYRGDWKIWRLNLSAGMYALLAPLVRGASLEEAFETDLGEVADIGAWFSQWTAEGFFTATKTKTGAGSDR